MPEPVLTDLWLFVERFQTLISGVLAIVAAFITAVVIYCSAHAPLKAERKNRAGEATARANAHALALLVEVQHVSDRAGYINRAVTDPDETAPIPEDTWREWLRVETPPSLQDWHIAAAHPPPIPERLKGLALALLRYQWYVDTIQGWSPRAIHSHTEKIDDHARDVIKAIEDNYGLSAQS